MVNCLNFEMVFVLQNLLSKIFNRGWKREEVRKDTKCKHVQIINIKLTYVIFSVSRETYRLRN